MKLEKGDIIMVIKDSVSESWNNTIGEIIGIKIDNGITFLDIKLFRFSNGEYSTQFNKGTEVNYPFYSKDIIKKLTNDELMVELL